MLTAISCALLWVYNASVDSLIHLYVIGVFTAFTLSQAGMVRYWLRTREPGWRTRIAINLVGASATGLVTAIVIWTKFAEGAWLVTVAIPVLVACFLGINRHYRRFARRLSAGVGAVAGGASADERGPARGRVDRRRDRGRALVRAADRATARRCGRCSRRASTRIPGSGRAGGTSRRSSLGSSCSPTTEGSTQALLEEVWRLPRGESDFVTVVVPEQFQRPLAALGRAARARSG